MNLSDDLGEDVGAEVGEVVPIDRRDDGMPKIHFRNSRRHPMGFGATRLFADCVQVELLHQPLGATIIRSARRLDP